MSTGSPRTTTRATPLAVCARVRFDAPDVASVVRRAHDLLGAYLRTNDPSTLTDAQTLLASIGRLAGGLPGRAVLATFFADHPDVDSLECAVWQWQDRIDDRQRHEMQACWPRSRDGYYLSVAHNPRLETDVEAVLFALNSTPLPGLLVAALPRPWTPETRWVICRSDL